MAVDAKFRRTVDERFSQARKAMEESLVAFANQKGDARLGKVTEVRDRCRDLLDILNSSDYPRWLQKIFNAANQHVSSNNASSAANYLNVLANNLLSVVPIEFVESADDLYDFDKMYETLRDEHRLPELFDKMIEAITRIIENDEVDSRAITEALTNVVDVLRANRSASYVSTVASFDYMKCGWKFCTKMLKRIPGIQEAIESVEETIHETEESIEKVRTELHQQVVESVLLDAPKLEKITQISQVRPDLLPAPEETEDVEDAEFSLKSDENESSNT